jgi:hypothetical protein
MIGRVTIVLRVRDVVAYLRVSHQRVTQIYAEGKLPDPERIDGIGPLWKPPRSSDGPSGNGGIRGVGGNG